MDRKALRVQDFLQVVHTVLNAVHVLNRGLNWRESRRDRRCKGRFQEAWAKSIHLCERQAPSERERDEMTAASTVAVSVRAAWLTIALIIDSVHFAAVLSTVSWHLIAPELLIKVIPVSYIIVVIHVSAIVNFRGDCTGAEGTLDESLALHGSLFSHLTAASARALRVRAACHTVTLV